MVLSQLLVIRSMVLEQAQFNYFKLRSIISRYFLTPLTRECAVYNIKSQRERERERGSLEKLHLSRVSEKTGR